MKRLIILLFFISTNISLAEVLPISGTITQVDLEGRTIFIDNIPFRFNDKTIVTAEGSAIDPYRLEPGTSITFEFNNSLITQIEAESPIEFND